MGDREQALLDFTKTRVNSFIKWDLVKFFCNGAQTMDTVEDIARHIGRRLEAVRSEMEALVKDGILEKRMLNEKSIYSLTTNEPIRSLVEQFVLACEDRSFRVKAVEYIIKGMR